MNNIDFKKELKILSTYYDSWILFCDINSSINILFAEKILKIYLINCKFIIKEYYDNIYMKYEIIENFNNIEVTNSFLKISKNLLNPNFKNKYVEINNILSLYEKSKLKKNKFYKNIFNIIFLYLSIFDIKKNINFSSNYDNNITKIRIDLIKYLIQNNKHTNLYLIYILLDF